MGAIDSYKVKSGRTLKEDSSTVNIANLISSTLGQDGGKFVANTNATTPASGYVFVKIEVIADCVITLVGNITGITTISLTAGKVIYGRYTSLTLASGSVIAYNGV